MQKNIHIDNIERTFAKTGNEKFVLISGKEKFQFWGTEQGQDSTVKDQFTDLGVKPNMDVQIEYLEEPESFTGKDGNLVNWTKRSIRGIYQATGTPTPLIPETRTTVANNASQSQSKDDKFWDMKAYKQCLWGYWLQSNKDIKTDDWKQFVWDTFQEIEKDAKKRFFDFSEPLGKAEEDAYERKTRDLGQSEVDDLVYGTKRHNQPLPGDEFLPNEPEDIYNTRATPF